MNTPQLILEVVIFCYVLWLGLYLIGRSGGARFTIFAGAGALTYALMLACDLLYQANGTAPSSVLIARISWPLPLALSAFWVLATLALLADSTQDMRLTELQRRFPILLAIYAILYAISAGTGIVFDYTALPAAPPVPAYGYPIFVAVVVVPLVGSGLKLLTRRPRHSRPALLIATLLFLLGSASLLIVWNIVPRTVLLLSLASDLILFGAAIAVLDAHGQGEILLPHFLRSMNAALLAALIFGGQVALVMALSTGLTAPLLLLLLTTCAAAIAFQVFADPLQKALDRLTFRKTPQLSQSRAELRDLASNLPRLNDAHALQTLDDEEFIRLTRRALSDFGNLPRLATNPLTLLPQVERRIADSGGSMNALERASELKRLLVENIECLKPRDGRDFGTSNEWRHYNALYFPYVCGLKPYSRRVQGDAIPAPMREALAWFQAQVPERTLHNWQNAAARLIAQNLRQDNLQS